MPALFWWGLQSQSWHYGQRRLIVESFPSTFSGTLMLKSGLHFQIFTFFNYSSSTVIELTFNYCFWEIVATLKSSSPPHTHPNTHAHKDGETLRSVCVSVTRFLLSWVSDLTTLHWCHISPLNLDCPWPWDGQAIKEEVQKLHQIQMVCSLPSIRKTYKQKIQFRVSTSFRCQIGKTNVQDKWRSSIDY